jgi:hypothetical protein
MGERQNDDTSRQGGGRKRLVRFDRIGAALVVARSSEKTGFAC